MSKKVRDFIFLMSIFLFVLISCTYNKDTIPEPIEIPENGVMMTYMSHSKAIFDNKCISCHSPTPIPPNQSQMPYLTTYQEVKTQADNGRIQARIIEEIPSVMPVSGSLSMGVKDTIQFWLNQGALE